MTSHTLRSGSPPPLPECTDQQPLQPSPFDRGSLRPNEECRRSRRRQGEARQKVQGCVICQARHLPRQEEEGGRVPPSFVQTSQPWGHQPVEPRGEGNKGARVKVKTSSTSRAAIHEATKEASGSRGNGRECSRRVFEHLSTTKEAYLGLCALGTQGATDVGSYSLRLAASQRSLTSGLEPSLVTELLPIPLDLALPFLSSLGRGLMPSGDKSVPEGALGILAALNFLYGVGWSDTPIFPTTKIILGPGHIKVLRHLWCSAYSFLGRGVVPFSLTESITSLKERGTDYSGGAVSVRRRLEAAKVIPAWPKVGHACVVPIFHLVDSELQAELSSPDSILLPESEWPAVTPSSSVHADDDEWYDICVAGHARKMFVPIAENEVFRNNLGEKVIAGAMGVEKSKK